MTNDFGSRNTREHITSRLRWRGFDYTTPGLYFVTICCYQRSRLLGRIEDRHLVSTLAGDMVQNLWDDIPTLYPDATVDCHVVMPNHVHALIGLGAASVDNEVNTSLIEIIHWFKSYSTTMYIRGVREHGWKPFPGHVWQSGFHDHYVRTERDLNVLREYVAQNPARWEEDVHFGRD